MIPVLFSIGQFTVSSFGLFLLLSFIVSFYIFWRLIKLYELDQEKGIDLAILTIAFTLIFSRALFVLFNLNFFDNIFKILLINRYSGLSFYGGLLGVVLTLIFFAKRLKFNLYQVADFILVASLLGISIGSLGCLLGSCQFGLPSNIFFAVPQAGLIYKRFPLQIIYFFIFLMLFFIFWSKVQKHNRPGIIAALGLISLSAVNLILEFSRGDRLFLYSFISLNLLFAALSLIGGLYLFYSISRRHLLNDIFFFRLFFIKRKRGEVVSKIKKSCYNLLVKAQVRLNRSIKGLVKILHVKSNPTKF